MSLKTLIKKYNLSLDDDFIKSCEIFISLLQKWGKIHNLTGNLEQSSIEKNIIDSIYPIEFLEDFESLADIGTGAGFPGLILAMYYKEKDIYLIEPRVKRVSFLNFVKASLGLKNLKVLQKRVEDVEDLEVDLITSRAVTNTKLLLDITSNIKKSSSSYLFYKGSMLDDELETAKINNYKIVSKDDRNYLYIKGKEC